MLCLESWASYKAREFTLFATGEPLTEGLREAVVFFGAYRTETRLYSWDNWQKARDFIEALRNQGLSGSQTGGASEGSTLPSLSGSERAEVFREYFRDRRVTDRSNGDYRERSRSDAGDAELGRGLTFGESRPVGENGSREGEDTLGTWDYGDPTEGEDREGEEAEREEEREAGPGLGPWGTPPREDGSRGSRGREPTRCVRRRTYRRDGSGEAAGSRGTGGNWNFERGGVRWPE